MISYSVIAMLVLDLIICFVLPIVLFIIIQVKYKKTFKAFILGALAFFVSQIVLRIPIISYVLPQFAWYTVFQLKYPYLQWIFLGLTAGIFEEIGRLILIKFCMKKNQRFIDGITFGLGHGAIEAMLITGITFINLLVFVIMINNKTFDVNLSTLPAATLNQIYNQCINMTPLDAILGGIERIFAMGMHIGFTMIIFKGVRKNKEGMYLIIAILLHGIVDASIGFMSQMFGFSNVAMEAVFGIISIVLVAYALSTKNRVKWQEENCELKLNLHKFKKRSI